MPGSPSSTEIRPIDVEHALENSQRLIHALHNPAAYPHDVQNVEELETHISWVLLTGEFAYKIKKPVDLGFADFSTLEKRRRFCDDELRLNRRLCPELYLEVAPIAGSVDAPQIGGAGTAIDYAVVMRQFPQDQLLSRLIADGEVDAGCIDRLAVQVAGFHERIERDETGPHGTPETVLEFAEQNFESLLAAEADAVDQSNVESLLQWTRDEFERRRDVFCRRKAGGFVRECHGDMHLGNMAADNGGVLIFDCIEFNPELRWIDVMDEVAFTVMDLEDRGRPDFAMRFLDGYLSHSGDYAGLEVLPFYLVYRALVRAKVAMLRLGQLSAGKECSAAVAECSEYLNLARQYSRPAHPRLSITHGVSGSGKTTGSQSFLEEHHAIRIRSDVERKRLLGIGPTERTAEADKEHAYSAETTAQTYARLLEHSRNALRAGFSVVADATFLRRKDRDRFHQLASELNVPFQILDFQADVETLRERVTRRGRSGNDASEADLSVLEQQLATEDPLADDERPFVFAMT